MTVFARDLETGLRDLRLGEAPVIVHASLKSFGYVDGGAAVVVDSLLNTFPSVMVPTFTYKTMITPPVGPADNGITYGSGQEANRMAEFFTPDMPADPLMGLVPETLRQHPLAKRTGHPIQSFAGIHAEAFLAMQTLTDPLAPLSALAMAGGWVLLIGVNHTVNTSIHYAEKMAGRKTFIRWALTPQGVVECPSFPGCSAGFDAIAPALEMQTRRVRIGDALVQAVSLRSLFNAVIPRIRKNPLALLCQQEDCERCGEIRKQVIGGWDWGKLGEDRNGSPSENGY
jgi:aminoglycoside 3-N-acetyltransferase